jgi:tetrahedral aminopeptidase
MKTTADKNKIQYQTEILTGGGTDTAAIQQMTEGGAIVGCVSIPARHIHQPIEMVHKKDVEGSIDLLTACVNSMDKYDWSKF